MDYYVEQEYEMYEANLSESTKRRNQNMSNTVQEVLTVEAINQYGIKYNGKNYSISTRLAQSGVTPQHFQVGSKIRAEVWTGPQGGKKINSFQPEMGAAPVAPAPVYQQPAPALPPMPPMPSLPVTTVAATPAPGGSPVVNKSYSNGKASASADNSMSKEDWKNKDLAIELVAVIKSSIESPALGEHVTGKSTPEFLQLTRDFIKHNLETLKLAKEGTL